MACRTLRTDVASRRCVCDDDSVSNCSRGTFCCNTRNDSSSRQCEYAYARSMNIFGQTPWHNIHTDIVYAPNGDSSNDTLSRPIVESVAHILRICTVCRRCEVSYVPIRRSKMDFRFLHIINKNKFYTSRTSTYFQRAGSKETFTANIALMRPFSAMRSHVIN